jgi:hypothetical protein
VQARDLKIKFLLHYGQAGVYQIANFEKIAGLDVVIAHRLLKNSVPMDEYVLITRALQTEKLPGGSGQWHPGEDAYPIIGTIPYSYRRLDRSLVQEFIPPPFLDRIDSLSSHL